MGGLGVCHVASGLLVVGLVRVVGVHAPLVVVVVLFVVVVRFVCVVVSACRIGCICRCGCVLCILGISICVIFLVLFLRQVFRRLGMLHSVLVPILRICIVVQRLVDLLVFVCVV